MTSKNLNRIFKPANVAVIGASPREGSVGTTVMANLTKGAFPGKIFPVNPVHKEIAGLPAFANVLELPEPVDLALVCTPARTVATIADECGKAGIPGMVIMSAGFAEIGGKGTQLQRELSQVVQRHDELRVIGPNCLGVISPHHCLNASFAANMPQEGRIAFISQSGALCTAVLDWAQSEEIGFSHFVSIGNSMDVGIGDLIEYMATDSHTDAIILYIESISDPHEFMTAARSFSLNKPIIAYKAGRFTKSAEAAASHTGALAGVDAVYDAAFRRAGIVRVSETGEMFDCAELLAREKRPQGPNVAIVTNAGGPGVMAADELLEHNGTLATLGESTISQLNQVLPANWSRANPVDVVGDATPKRFANAMKIVLADENVDSAIALFSPQAMSEPTDAASALIEIEKTSTKPILACWMGGMSMKEAIRLFNSAGVPTYPFPEQAVRAIHYLACYVQNRKLLNECPESQTVHFSNTEVQRRHIIRSALEHCIEIGTDTLSEAASKDILAAYDIPVSKTLTAKSIDEAISRSNEFGYPVAMKIVSAQITHKTDVGGVLLNLLNAEAVAQAFQSILASAKNARPDAKLDGVTIQRMHGGRGSRELILGAKRDSVFGNVLLVGAGGTATELIQDRALELPPLSKRLAHQMLTSLRFWPMLNGFRGDPPVQIDRLLDVVMRFSNLVAEFPEIKELDINPLLATPDDVVALDARIVFDPTAVNGLEIQNSHMVIHPDAEE